MMNGTSTSRRSRSRHSRRSGRQRGKPLDAETAARRTSPNRFRSAPPSAPTTEVSGSRPCSSARTTDAITVKPRRAFGSAGELRSIVSTAWSATKAAFIGAVTSALARQWARDALSLRQPRAARGSG